MSDDKVIQISSKVVNKNLAEAEAVRLPDGTTLSEQDVKTLVKMNTIYTHAVVGGKNLIISLKHCQVQGQAFTFEPLEEFRKGFMHKPKLGVEKKKNPAQAWLEWGGKNYKPDGTGFYPIPDKCPATVFNFFQGYRVQPKAGDCTVYLEHLQHIICNNDPAAYAYLIGWMAHLFQKPDEKPNVAIVLKSVEGTGKGAMVEPLMMILGTHGNKTNGSYALAGRFNGIIANRLLIFADEVDLTDKHTADRLKSIITETTVNLERKGLEIEPLPNNCRLIFASNHGRVLNAGIRERRYLVLEPSEAKAQDSAYFTALWAWTHNGGAAHLLHYLLQVDISDFNPYKCPQTQALIDEKLAALSGINRYFYTEIMKAEPFDGKLRINAGELVTDFMTWCESHDIVTNEPAARSVTGKMMVRLNVTVGGRSDRGGGKVYEIPDRDVLVQQFANLLDIPDENLNP